MSGRHEASVSGSLKGVAVGRLMDAAEGASAEGG